MDHFTRQSARLAPQAAEQALQCLLLPSFNARCPKMLRVVHAPLSGQVGISLLWQLATFGGTF